MRKHATARGVWGHAPPEIFWNLKAMKLLLRPFFPKRCFSEARRQNITYMNIYPFCPLRHIALHGFGFPIVRLEERKIVGRLGLPYCSQPSHIMLQHVTTLIACHGRLPSIGLFGDAKQAMGEGKSGPVETGLTGPVATALKF